jgi:hypothetical protein
MFIPFTDSDDRAPGGIARLLPSMDALNIAAACSLADLLVW